MTNAEKLRRILKETFPNVIFIWGFSEERKEVSIHMSTNWLEDSYTEKEQEPCEDGMWSLKDAADALKRHGLLQRQEPCEDAISKQAVLDWLASIAKVKARSDAQKALIGNVMFFVGQLPSVAPKPKTGHWIYTGDYLTEGMLKCSECGEEIDVSESYYDFCPVCGCRMVEPQESEGNNG